MDSDNTEGLNESNEKRRRSEMKDIYDELREHIPESVTGPKRDQVSILHSALEIIRESQDATHSTPGSQTQSDEGREDSGEPSAQTAAQQIPDLSEADYEEAFNSCLLPLAVLEKSGCVLQMNNEFAQLLRYEPDMLVGRDLSGFIQTETRQPLINILNDVTAENQTVDVPVIFQTRGAQQARAVLSFSAGDCGTIVAWVSHFDESMIEK